jgi:flagellar biosynthetic protein FliR
MTLDLASLVEGKVFAFLLIFCRIGAISMSLPGIGEAFVPERIRLQLALLISFILMPLLSPHMPAMPQNVAAVVEMIVVELGFGIFIGLITRILLGALEVAGMLISMQIGLSNAMILNPTMASQGSVPGGLLSMLGVLLIFESGLLSMLLQAFAQSYILFKPGMLWPVADMSQFFAHTVNDSFSLALQLVAPFMILGIVFQVTAGIMVKMIPQMQIFFVAAPLQIFFGLAVFAFAVVAIMNVWGRGFEELFLRLFNGGGTGI